MRGLHKEILYHLTRFSDLYNSLMRLCLVQLLNLTQSKPLYISER